MAFSKAPLYPKILFNQATWSKIQAYPARIRILQHLLTYGPTPFATLKAINPEISAPTVARHIAYLRKYNVITIEDKWPKALYNIEASMVRQLAHLLGQLQNQFSQGISYF